MRKIQTWILITLLASVAGTSATRAQNRTPDSLAALKEFAQLGQMYRHPSVRLAIHIEQTTNLPTGTTDSLQTDMDLYYGKPDFYMKAEGLEQVSNDSMVVMVNKPGKRMIMSRHDRQVSSIERTLSMFMPDSSIQALSKRYRSSVKDAGDGKMQLTLTSRDLVYGTDIPREIVQVIYHPSSHEMAAFKQIKTSLVPVDSAVFEQLRKEQAFQGKMIISSTGKGKLFFTTKERIVTCRFDKIEYGLVHPPVAEGDRVEKLTDGTYRPAKGFEEYVLTNQL